MRRLGWASLLLFTLALCEFLATMTATWGNASRNAASQRFVVGLLVAASVLLLASMVAVYRHPQIARAAKLAGGLHALSHIGVSAIWASLFGRGDISDAMLFTGWGGSVVSFGALGVFAILLRPVAGTPVGCRQDRWRLAPSAGLLLVTAYLAIVPYLLLVAYPLVALIGHCLCAMRVAAIERMSQGRRVAEGARTQ